MIEEFQSALNKAMPGWVQVRCTKLFIGHMLLFSFLIAAHWVVSFFHVHASEILSKSIAGAAFFLFTRFVFHEHRTLYVSLSATGFVIFLDLILPVATSSQVISSWPAFLQRFPALIAMITIEILEEETLEEEIEGYKDYEQRAE